MTTQPGEDRHLDADQADELARIAHDIAAHWPDPDDHHIREAALTTARRLLAGDTAVVAELAAELAAVREADRRVKGALRQAALMTIVPGARGAGSELAFAGQVGVNRLTVRGWLGKPNTAKPSRNAST
ncbi:hypothetical protein [Actinosynnema sp. NPDC023587]|uniref:hypothetical protein n=1 Tax=Actinosynnema sp. NPDC023587 TaxID=3154695 RepID=UPI0033F7B782